MPEATTVQKEGSLIAAVDKRANPTVTTPQEGVVKFIRDNQAADASGESILKGVREARQMRAPLKLTEIIQKNIPDATDATRISLESDAKTISTFLEKDLSALPAGEADKVIKSVADIIGSLPDADRLFPPGQRNTIAKEMLNDPKVREKIRAVVDGRTGSEALFGDAHAQAESAYQDAVHTQEDKQKEIDRNTARLNEVTRKINEYAAPGTPEGGATGGAQYRARQDAETFFSGKPAGYLEGREADVTSRTNTIASINEQITKVKGRTDERSVVEFGRLQALLEEENPALADAQKDLAEARAHQAVLANYDQNKRQLETEHQQLEDNKTKLDREKAKIDKTVHDTNADRGLVGLNRTDQIDALQRNLSIDGVIGDAVVEYLDEEYQANIEAVKKDMEAKGEKKLPEAMKKRWERPTVKGKKAKDLLDKGQIERDYQKLLGGKISEVIEDALHVQGGLSADEAKQIASDPAYIEKYKAEVAQQVLAYRLRTGKVTEADAASIYNQYGSVESVNAAIGRNADFKSALEQLKGEGVLKGTDAGAIKDFVRENPGKAAIIAALLAALAAGAVAPALAGTAAFAAFK